MEEMTMLFDDTVRDKSLDKRVLVDKKRWQAKLITAKILVETLEKIQWIKKSKALKELNEYSIFDRRCHQKLKSFANLCYRLGMWRQKVALHQWYSRALKPLQSKNQNQDISLMIECNQLQARVFYAWRQYQNDKLDRYHFKTNAIEKTWHLLSKGAKSEVKRALDIWKAKCQFAQEKQRKYLQLMMRKKNNALGDAFRHWKQYNTLIEYHVRTRILHRTAAERMLMSQVFSHLRI